MSGARTAMIAGAVAALMLGTPAGFADGSCGSDGRHDRGRGGSWSGEHGRGGGIRIVIPGGRDRRDRDECDEVQTARVCERLVIDGKEFEAVVTLVREDGCVRASVRLESVGGCSLPKIDSIRLRVRGASSAWSPEMCRRGGRDESDTMRFESEASVRWSERQVRGLRIDLTVESCEEDDRATWRRVSLV